MAEAEAALGHPIEVISGIEEARLIYTGVSHSLPPNDGQRLVIDIGGGSTEVILGRGAEPRALESLHLGCVSMTERFFPGGKISRDAFDRARVAARLELRPVKAFFRSAGEFEAIGTSGTILATEQVARALRLQESGQLTLATVETLIDKVCEVDAVERLVLNELSERRAQVWPGGLAILAEIIRALRIPALRISDGALREGLLYDLLGRLQHEDARERTVQAMQARFHVDVRQAARVAATAQSLLDSCAQSWQLTSELDSKMLGWAARLHEIGLDISHDGFHRHGAYVAENADMPGFPRAEQRLLAFLIGSQRHEINTKQRKQLPRAWREDALRLVMLLRLAVLLNRSRNDDDLPYIGAAATAAGLHLSFDNEWLTANPLTAADLQREQNFVSHVGYALTFSSGPVSGKVQAR